MVFSPLHSSGITVQFFPEKAHSYHLSWNFNYLAKIQKNNKKRIDKFFF